MAAAGSLEVNSLAKRVTGQLRDRRQDGRMEVTATFGFLDPPEGVRAFPEYPSDWPHPPRTSELEVISTVWLEKDSSSLRASSRYSYASKSEPSKPLDAVRDMNVAHWFVAGYGIARALPDAGQVPELQQPSIERIRPLFDSSLALTSTAFSNYFHKQEKGELYSRVLRSVLFRTGRLLPRISDLELGGPGGVKRAGDLAEQNQIQQEIGAHKLTIPMTALSHGYQSTIAWIADLIGHIVLEANGPIEPDEMQGIVLIDEIDLYLHPTWQVALIAALRETFPRIQFIATTHSPLVLAGMHPTEIVRLRFTDDGNVERAPIGADARVMTGTEIYREYFGIEDIIPDQAGQKLRDYRYLAANPYRSDKEDLEIIRLREALAEAGIDPGFVPVERIRP
jgi:hypothetical protein